MEAVNSLSEEQFVSLFGNVVEHAPGVARAVAAARPLRSPAELLAALDTAIAHLDMGEKVEILNR